MFHGRKINRFFSGRQHHRIKLPVPPGNDDFFMYSSPVNVEEILLCACVVISKISYKFVENCADTIIQERSKNGLHITKMG